MRRAITAQVDLIIRDVREEVLNLLLDAAFDRFTEAIASKEKIKLEEGDEKFIRVKVEAALRGALAELDK